MTTPMIDEDPPQEEDEEEVGNCIGECDCGECDNGEDEQAAVGGSVGDRFAAFIEHIQARGFQYLSMGGFRRTYQRGKVVIKVPHVNDGLVDNRVEAAVWRKYKSQPTDLGIYLAPCRLLSNGCLMMVTIDHWNWDIDKPLWSSKIDSGQIGTYKGRAVAYDYALDNTERYQLEQEWNHFSVFFQEDWVINRKPHLKKESAA